MLLCIIGIVNRMIMFSETLLINETLLIIKFNKSIIVSIINKKIPVVILGT